MAIWSIGVLFDIEQVYDFKHWAAALVFAGGLRGWSGNKND